MKKDIDNKEIIEAFSGRKEIPEDLKRRLEEQGILEDIKPRWANYVPYDKAPEIIQTWKLKEQFEDLENEKIDIRDFFLYKLDCNSPSYLFSTNKFFHQRSTISKEDFFFGVVLIVTKKVKEIEGKRPRFDWDLAQKIMYEITGDNRYLLDVEYLEGLDKRKKRMTIYKKGLRSVQIVARAYWDRISRFDELVLFFFRHFGLREKKREIKINNDLMLEIYRFIEKEGEVTQRQLLARFQSAGGQKVGLRTLIPFLTELDMRRCIVWDIDHKKIKKGPAMKKLIGEKRSSGPDHIQDIKAVSPSIS